MKIVFITPYAFPSTKAEPYYAKSLALAFAEHLKENFLFVVNGIAPPELAGIHVISTKKRKHLRTLFYFLQFPFFIRRHKIDRSDVVLFSNDPFFLLIFILWKKVLRARYRVCADWHLMFDDWKDTIIARESDALISTTERLKECTVAKCHVAREKILVAYGGIDEDLLATSESESPELIRGALGLPKDVFLVGYAGTYRSLGLEKGLITMIEALRELPEDIRMAFVGGTGEQIPEYEAIAREQGVFDRCVFVKRQPFAEVMRYERGMDVLVIPYPDQPHFRDYGFPLKVWEYMASGRPIVYSNLEIIAEVLLDRGTPFVPDSPASLADAILIIRDSFSQMEMISQKNMSEIKQYTWSKKTEKIINFLDKK